MFRGGKRWLRKRFPKDSKESHGPQGSSATDATSSNAELEFPASNSTSSATAGQTTNRNKVLDVSMNALKIGQGLGEAVPLAGGPLKAACSILLTILEAVRVGRDYY